jgi:hypothetical protein
MTAAAALLSAAPDDNFGRPMSGAPHLDLHYGRNATASRQALTPDAASERAMRHRTCSPTELPSTYTSTSTCSKARQAGAHTLQHGVYHEASDLHPLSEPSTYMQQN